MEACGGTSRAESDGRMEDVRFMKCRGLSLVALTLGLVVAVCGIAPAPAAGATPHGCEPGKAVDTVSTQVQALEAPAVLPCYGQEVLRPMPVSLLPPSPDADFPGSLCSEEVSSRAPPVSS